MEVGQSKKMLRQRVARAVARLRGRERRRSALRQHPARRCLLGSPYTTHTTIHRLPAGRRPKTLCNIHAAAAPASETARTLRQPPLLRRALTYLRIIFDAPVARPDVGQKTLASPTARANARNDGNDAGTQTDDPTQALAKLQSTRASLTD